MAGYNGKDSVATQWANMVADAARGEVVAIMDKHGNDVAVMVSKEHYDHLTSEIKRLESEVDAEWHARKEGDVG